MEQILDKQMMDALRELAKINGEISTGKAELIALKSNMELFLQEREKISNERIRALLAESQKTIQAISTNESQVQSYLNEVASFSKFLKEIHESFNTMVLDFKKEQEEWSQSIEKQNKQLGELKKEVEYNSRLLDSDRRYIENAKKQIAKDKEYIKNQQQTIKSSLLAIKKKKS